MLTGGPIRGHGSRTAIVHRPVVHSVRCWLPVTQTWLYNQVRHLPDWVESHVACSTTENLDAFRVPRVTSAETRRLHRLDRTLRRATIRPLGPVREVVEEARARLLHSHFGNVACFDRRTARRLGLRHIISFYGVDVGQLPRNERWRRRYHLLFGEAAAALCEGPHMAAALADLGCDPEKIHVHRLGVDLERLPPFRPRWWAAGRPLRVLLAGSFREKKGIPVAMDALGRLVREGVDVYATLIGDAGPRDRREKERILAAIDRNGIGGRVRLLGYQPYDRLLAEAVDHDVFMSPSVTAADGDSEGGAPIAIIEMAAIGLPILSTRHCDIPGVLGEPNRRLLVPERDPPALASACLDLLGSDWTSIGLANRELVEREFDCRRQGERLARIYFPDMGPQTVASAHASGEAS